MIALLHPGENVALKILSQRPAVYWITWWLRHRILNFVLRI